MSHDCHAPGRGIACPRGVEGGGPHSSRSCGARGNGLVRGDHRAGRSLGRGLHRRGRRGDRAQRRRQDHAVQRDLRVRAPESGTLRVARAGAARDATRPACVAGVARTLQGVGLFGQLSVLENVMAGADRFRRSRYGGALLGLWTSDRDERRAARPAPRDAGQARLRGNRGPAARDAAVRGAEARGAGARAGLRPRAAAARRARGRPRRRRADRARRADPHRSGSRSR